MVSEPFFLDLSQTVLVTHQNCLDGSGCAVLFVRAGGRVENVRYCPAGALDRMLAKPGSADLFDGARPLLVTDLGVSRDNADILEKAGHVRLLDHHRTSLGLSERHWCTLDMDRCATEMLADELGLRAVPTLAETATFVGQVGAFDMFRTGSDDFVFGEALAMYHQFVGQEEFVAEYSTKRCLTGLIREKTELLRTLARRRVRNVDKILSTLRIREGEVMTMHSPPVWTSLAIGYVFGDEDISFALHRVLDAHPDVDVAAGISVGAGTVSLRSRDGRPDVSEIARVHGGGGHAAAAGHRLPSGLIEELISEVH